MNSEITTQTTDNQGEMIMSTNDSFAHALATGTEEVRDEWASAQGFESWEGAIVATQDLTQQAAGDLLGVTHATVLTWRRRLGLPAKPQCLTAAARAARFRADLDDARHGTPSGYRNYGCRCARCTGAWTDYLRDRRQTERAARQAAQGVSA